MAGEGLQALGAFLDDIARRRATLARRRAFSQGGAVAAAVLLITAAILRLAAPGHLLLVAIVVVAVGAALAALAVALWPGPATPALQLARLVEERHGGLDDVVVTAVDYRTRPDHDPVMADRLARAAERAVADLGADAVVAPADLTRSGRLALAAGAALLVAAGVFVRPLGDAASVAAAYLLPSRIEIAVEPGDVRLRAGQALTVRARVRGADAVAPTLVSGDTADAVPVPMTRQDDGSFLATVGDVTASFVYRVVAGARRSDEYSVTVVHPPVVERIALEYHYPKALGLPVRSEDDGGDIYAPEGTEVRFTITADRPVAASALALGTGPRVPLAVNGRTVTGALTIAADDAYRVLLADDDGSDAPDDTEYFIRTLLDRPPDVRVLRPAGDRQVTALEEVLIEARADDDFGITALDLVLQKPGDAEVVVPLPGPRDGLTASGSYLLFLEDLEVSPGDFVTYFVRARDVGRGKPPSESRSDMFFLEVKAFDDEFVAAQSQAMASGAQSQGVQDLAAAQKEIVVATWKLDARGRRARSAQSAADVRAVAAAQRALEQRAAREAGGQLQSATGSDPRRRRGRASANAVGDNPMGLAIEAMRRAAVELEGLRTEAAMPHELEALNQLLKAETDVKRRQVARQQNGGGGGGNRNSPDLSSLFDQELRRQQQTNYETPASSETRQDERQAEDPLERLRELARRQEAMSREQRDLARNGDGLDPETVKRRLERLSRDQETLRRELEELARQLPERQGERQASSQPSPSGQEPRPQSGQQGQQGQQGQTSQGQPGQQSPGQSGQTASGPRTEGGGSSRQSLRDAAEEMRRASAGLQQQDPTRASENAERALERLRQAEQGLRGSTADDRRRQLGDLQLETRQLADAERRVSQELERAGDSARGSEARRQAAADQDRLAGRAERLQRQLQDLRGQAQSAAERDAIGRAARDLESQRVAERMRQTARGVREGGQEPAGTGDRSATTTRREGQPAPQDRPADDGPAREGAAIARALDEVAGRLDAARDGDRGDAVRLSDELSRARELRDRLAEVERSLERLSAEGQRRDRPAADRSPTAAGRPQTGSAREPGARDGEPAGAAEIADLQRQLAEQLRETRERVEALSRDNPELRGPATPEQWQPSVSAPGTEAFKQDFARWESLKSNLLSALEKVERSLTTQLREQETRDRLNVGGADTVPDDYRALVERYYRSLAAPRRQER